MSTMRNSIQNAGESRGCQRNRSYFVLVKYLAPLTLTLIAIDVGEQALYRSLSSSLTSVKTLAAFGIAYMIIKLATGLISEVKLVSIMLIHDIANRRKVMICVLVVGLMVCLVNLLIGFTQFGFYLIDKLHQVPPDVGKEARTAILYLSAFPLIDGLAWLHTGILLKNKYSVTVGFASIADNIFQVLTVVVLLQTSLPRTNPIVIPVLATYLGTLARLLIAVIAYYKCIHKRLKNAPENEELVGSRHERALTLKRIIALWAPLGLVQLCQRICRPIINLFVARDRSLGMTREQAVEAVAILSVCYPIGHLPYGWLNTLRLIQPTFTKKKLGNETTVTVNNIRIFNFTCFSLSALIMIILFWIPGVARSILTNISNVDQSIISKAIQVLHVFTFFPIPVANRANLTGMFVSHEKSKYLYPSVPTRIIVLISSLFILPRVGVQGAMMGIAALLAAFVSESLCLVIMAFVLKYRKVRERKEESVARTDDVQESVM